MTARDVNYENDINYINQGVSVFSIQSFPQQYWLKQYTLLLLVIWRI